MFYGGSRNQHLEHLSTRQFDTAGRANKGICERRSRTEVLPVFFFRFLLCSYVFLVQREKVHSFFGSVSRYVYIYIKLDSSSRDFKSQTIWCTCRHRQLLQNSSTARVGRYYFVTAFGGGEGLGMAGGELWPFKRYDACQTYPAALISPQRGTNHRHVHFLFVRISLLDSGMGGLFDFGFGVIQRRLTASIPRLLL